MVAPLCLRCQATLKPISFIYSYKNVCACRSSVMDIPSVPTGFPQRSFGQKNPVKRSVQSSWFANRTWSHCDEANWKGACVAFKNTTLPGAIVIS